MRAVGETYLLIICGVVAVGSILGVVALLAASPAPKEEARLDSLSAHGSRQPGSRGTTSLE